MLIEDRSVNASLTFRVSKNDSEELQAIADKIGCKVSQLLRYAVKKHIIAARAEFAKNPDVWK